MEIKFVWSEAIKGSGHEGHRKRVGKFLIFGLVKKVAREFKAIVEVERNGEQVFKWHRFYTRKSSAKVGATRAANTFLKNYKPTKK